MITDLNYHFKGEHTSEDIIKITQDLRTKNKNEESVNRLF